MIKPKFQPFSARQDFNTSKACGFLQTALAGVICLFKLASSRTITVRNLVNGPSSGHTWRDHL